MTAQTETQPAPTETTEATPATKTPRTPRVWPTLTKEEAAAALRVARPAIAPCLCGCGETTKGRFAPGHDATHHQRLRATAATGTPAARRIAAEALTAFGWAD